MCVSKSNLSAQMAEGIWCLNFHRGATILGRMLSGIFSAVFVSNQNMGGCGVAVFSCNAIHAWTHHIISEENTSSMREIGFQEQQMLSRTQHFRIQSLAH